MTESLESNSPSSPTFTDWARQWGGKILAPLVNVLARLGFSPNMVTIIGLLLNASAALLLASGRLAWGGGVMLAAGIFDALDGSLARLTGRQTRFGAFLDSTLDRYSEAFVFAGLAWFYLSAGQRLPIMLIIASLVGSIMVSYARARAEGLGIECKGGLLTRFERVLLIGIALLAGLIQPALWLLAILTNLTAVQRIISVWRATRDERQTHNKP